MAIFWKFQVYKFQLQRKGHSAYVSVKINGKTGRSRWENWFIIDLFLIGSKNLTELVLCIFFFVYLFSRNMSFFAYLACIYFRECRLKENFACISFSEIDQNSRKNCTHENKYT